MDVGARPADNATVAAPVWPLVRTLRADVIAGLGLLGFGSALALSSRTRALNSARA